MTKRSFKFLQVLPVTLSVCAFAQIIDFNVRVFDSATVCAPT